MYELFLIIFLIVSVILVAMVMLHQGKGTQIGASFGTSTNSALLSSSGSSSFMTRIIVSLAIIFFFLSLFLGNLSGQQKNTKSKEENFTRSVKHYHYSEHLKPVIPSQNIKKSSDDLKENK
ncbi:preprotein translocase subunit SecG [Candidatus Profftia tarda]|uniref:Protein-export membrane protein SecG n=1 Tax=Candidatus Profftia tarda TaxID=1177216 RepID=A0A8E4GHT2_9ENTR|nr:preprotein translocase subunit SecG [Candidatus Profftia tarda]CAD6510126.1 Protein-export membrane protein secG [Candidatus Profftia tarda]